MQWWMVGAAANAVIACAYLAIAFRIARGVHASRQWRTNPLAVATSAIFLTCAVHHGGHAVHLLGPTFGFDVHSGNELRRAFGHWHLSAWDVVGATVAIWYWTLRSRFPALVRGAAVFEDLRERQRQALDIHDNVVQGLAAAKLSFELGENEKGMAALESTLGSARTIITDLLGDGDTGLLRAGDLRRERAARIA